MWKSEFFALARPPCTPSAILHQGEVVLRSAVPGQNWAEWTNSRIQTGHARRGGRVGYFWHLCSGGWRSEVQQGGQIGKLADMLDLYGFVTIYNFVFG